MNAPLLLTPPSSPLAMPTQVLCRPPASRPIQRTPSTWLARWLTFGGSLALTVLAGSQMYLTLPFDAPVEQAPWLTAQLWVVLALFVLTFNWVALSAATAVAGLLREPQNRAGSFVDSGATLRGKTVLLMPICNEEAASACASLAAMGEELASRGLQQAFDIFILSDSNDPEVLIAEQQAVQRLRESLSGTLSVWYRRRERNTHRKAGNIADFIKRWGRGYDYMVVLDADSLIAGDTLAALVREMDADPSAGILQTLPRLYGGETLFARLQQFAGEAYGPVFARGLSAWQGADGNYWGHNAIIRIRAFAHSAGLPVLPGRRPFGGEILSHDFVEAALIRRAGWTVRMLPELGGSWEECPPTLDAAAIRDRRWAQGNVQHLAVLSARGLRWPSRAHMLMGVMNYLTSLLWLAMVTLGLALSVQLAGQPGSAIAGSDPPMFDSERMLGLFVLTVLLLLLPSMLGLTERLLNRERQGGRLPFLLSAIVELVFSILHAPIFMLIHSRHLGEIIGGRDSGWAARRQQGGSLTWWLPLARHGVHTTVGLLLLALVLWLPPSVMVWVIPMIVGLVMAIPLSILSGSRAAGRWLARRGLLTIPEERVLPGIMQRRQAFLEAYWSDAIR